MKKVHRLDSLDLLRGIAALMVCICHLSSALMSRDNYPGLFEPLSLLGKFGVYMFFIVSGFVMPLSLYKGKFKVSNYFTFIHKRIIRLHIPYVCALAGTLIIMSISPILRNKPFPENPHTIFQSLFYNHIPYNNLVFWTLAVEWQYYFFIGIFYCLLVRYPKLAVCIGIPVLLFVSQMQLLPSIHFFSFIAFFLIGNTGFLIYTKQGNIFLNRLVLVGLLLFVFWVYGLTASIFASLTIIFILFYKKSIPKPILFTGTISYSLYLIHYPIGFKFLDLPILQQQSAWLLFFIDLFIVVLLSYLFYKWIEIPSEKFARKFNYQRQLKYLSIPKFFLIILSSYLKSKKPSLR